LNEETGLDNIPLRLIGTVMIDAEQQRGIGLFVYRGEYQGGTLIESQEGTLEWIPLDKWDAYSLVEDLKRMLTRILAMQPGDAPFSARYTYDAQDQLHIEYVDS
jgi:hypothetical protein